MHNTWTLKLGESVQDIELCRDNDGASAVWILQRFVTLNLRVYSKDIREIDGAEITSIGHPLGYISLAANTHDVVGPEANDGLIMELEWTYQYHYSDPMRRIEDIMLGDDMPHIGDTLTVTRGGDTPIQWKGVIANVTHKPILHEALIEDLCGIYGCENPYNIVIYSA